MYCSYLKLFCGGPACAVSTSVRVHAAGESAQLHHSPPTAETLVQRLLAVGRTLSLLLQHRDWERVRETLAMLTVSESWLN